MTRFLEILFEIIGWIRIVISPVVIGGVTGYVIYYNNPDAVGIALGIGVASLGLLIGVIWATKVWRKHGTMAFLSRVDASPDIVEGNDSE
jgi:hypothetical protein